MTMQLKKQIDSLLRPLIGQKAWGASVGWGSFVTIEFGSKRLHHRHYPGDWHLWLYQCEWDLSSNGRLLAHSESKKKVMQLAIDNLNGAELKSFSFDSQRMMTGFSFDNDLRLSCKPYRDAVPDEQCWILFTPDRQAASLREGGIKYEPTDRIPEASLAQR
jgi:hypothetical protein